MSLLPQLSRCKNERLIYFIAFFGNGNFERAIWMIYLVAKGYSLAQIAVLQALLNVAMFIGEIPTGLFADRFGRRTSLLVGRFLNVLYLVGMLLADNIYLIGLSFMIYGFGLTFISGSEEALLYDSLKKDGRENESSKVVGRYMAIITIVLALAMAVGGFLHKISWSAVFLASAIFQAIAFFVCLSLKEISFEEEGQNLSFASLIKETKEFLQMNISLRVLLYGLAFYSGVVSIFYLFSQELFTRVGLQVAAISVIYSGESLISAFVSASAHKLEEKFANRKMIGIVMTFSILSFSLVFFDLPWTAVLGFLVINIIFNLFSPISYSIINQEIPSRQRATLLSIMSFVIAVVMSSMSLLFGFASKIVRFNVLVSTMGILITIAAWLCIRYFFKQQGDATMVEVASEVK